MNDPVSGDFGFRNPAADQRMAGASSLPAYLPWMLFYPLRGFALPLIVVLGALLWVVSQALIFGVVVMIFVVAWTTQYLFSVLDETMHGHATPPPLGTEVFSQPDARGLKLLAGVILLSALTAYVQIHFGHGAGRATTVVILLVLPAFIGVLAMGDSLLAAVNPVILGHFIIKTWAAYLVVCLLMVILVLSGYLLAGHIAGIFWYMFALYCAILVAHLLGFSIYSHHDALGLMVEVERQTDDTRRRDTQQHILKQVLAAVDQGIGARDSGAVKQALLVTDEQLDNPRAFHETLFEELQIRHEPVLIQMQGERLTTVLLRERRLDRALLITEMCLDVSAEYLPATAAQWLTLVEHAFETQQYRIFEKLANTQNTRFAGAPEAKAIQFYRALYAAEVKHDDAAALSLLTPLLQLEDHPLHKRITTLYKAVRNLAD